MSLKAAFIFVAPGAVPQLHRSLICTPQVDLTTIGVSDYAQAREIALALVEEGIGAIELCGGFGAAGVAAIAEAVGKRAVVGVVRFDHHPGLDYESGDNLFR